MDTIPIIPTKEEFFSLDDIEFEVKRLANGKVKDITTDTQRYHKIYKDIPYDTLGYYFDTFVYLMIYKGIPYDTLGYYFVQIS